VSRGGSDWDGIVVETRVDRATWKALAIGDAVKA